MFGNVTIIFLISLVSEILEQMMKKKRLEGGQENLSVFVGNFIYKWIIVFPVTISHDLQF